MTGPDKDNSKSLLTQQQALSSYLEALFRQAPDEPEQDSRHTATEPVTSSPLEDPVSAPSISIDLTPPISREVKPSSPAAEKKPGAPLPVMEKQGAAAIPAAAFQVLYFQVGMLKLAVPLDKLSGILKAAQVRVTAISGHTLWHSGVIRHQGITTNVVDTAKLVVPANRFELVSDQRPYRYFILIDQKRWGLGCHTLGSTVTLDPRDVTWRRERTNRPWLAGTVMSQMCALLDVDGFMTMLKKII